MEVSFYRNIPVHKYREMLELKCDHPAASNTKIDLSNVINGFTKRDTTDY